MKFGYFISPYIIFLTAFFSLTNIIFSDPTDGFLGDDIDFEEIFNDLPRNFDLEKAKISEFSNLPYFTGESAHNIVNFRDSLKTGNTLRNSLENIPGLSPIQLAILDNLSLTCESQVFSEFSGYYSNGFIHHPGKEELSEGKYYFKIRAESEKQINFTALGERDPFEPRALDLFSANVSVKLKKPQAHIIIGDYRPEFGQRLVFSRYSRSYGSGMNVKVNNIRIVDNTLFEEALYLRGVYLKASRGKITTQLWSSSRKMDATIDESGNAVTIKKTGYHYSGNDRGNLKETINALRLAFDNMQDLKFGVAGVVTRYSPALARQSTEKYLNYPEGSQFVYLSLDGELKKGPVILFFEHAQSNKKENATISGIEVQNKGVQSCFHLRNYSKGYWAPRAGSFSTFGKTTNERGIYSSVQAELPYESRFIASMDLARTLSCTFSETMPVSRKRLSFMLQSKFHRDLLGRIVARSVEDSGDGGKRQSYRLHLERKKRDEKNILGWRSTLAWSESNSGGGPYAEATLFLHHHKLKLNFSVGLFDIPSYESRFYRYEYNVPGRGFTRAVWGRGGTTLIVCSWGPLSGRYRFADSDLFDKSSEFTVQSDLIF